MSAGTYYVVLTYTPGGETRESPKSAQTAVTTSGGTASFTITSPSDPGNGAKWNAYVGTASGGPYFPQGTALTIGSNRVVTTTPPTTGTQPPGTDYSQQDAAQISYTDIVIGGTTTTGTSVANPFTPAMVGNLINITSGTGFTVQRVEITGVTAAGVATFDKSLGTTASTGGTGKLGGATDSPATINSAFSVSGMMAYIKYSATPYTLTASLTNNGANASWIGYDTTRTRNNTDANRPILRAGANSITLLTSNFAFRLVNLDVDNPSATFTGVAGFSVAGGSQVIRCRFSDLAGTAAVLFGGAGCLAADCEFVRCTSTRTLYFNAAGSMTLRCLFRSCTVPTVVSDGCTAIECIAYSCTGGFTTNATGSLFVRCVAYGCGGTGFVSSAGVGFAVTYDSCIAYGNTGSAYGFDSGIVPPHNSRLLNCRAGNNVNGDYDAPRFPSDQVTGFVHLTADPFTNAAGLDFSLNNTAGGGAACKALTVALPGGTTTSYPDAGAAQSQAASGPTYSSH